MIALAPSGAAPQPFWGMPATEHQTRGLHLLMLGKVHHVGGDVWRVEDMDRGRPDHVVDLHEGSCSNCEAWAHAKPRTTFNCPEKWSVRYKLSPPLHTAPPVDDWGMAYDDDELERVGPILRPLPPKIDAKVFDGKLTRGGYVRFASSYDAALRGEFASYVMLARALTQEIHWPEPRTGDELRGRKPFPLGTMIFAGLVMMRFRWSYRMTEGFLAFLQAVGWLKPAREQDMYFSDGRPREKFYPGFKALEDFVTDPSTSPHLRRFLRDTFRMLTPLSNSTIAMDMSGEGKNRYFDYWLNQRNGKRGKRDPKDWYKASPIMDVDTMATAGVVLTTKSFHESRVAPALIEMLLRAYAEGPVGSEALELPDNWEMLADGGYNDKDLREFVDKRRGVAYFPYAVNAVDPGKPGFAQEMYHRYSLAPRKWNEKFRMRVKNECLFASTDAIFGPSVRSQTLVGATNEVLLKFSGQNLRWNMLAMECFGLDNGMLGCSTALDTLRAVS